MQKWLLKASFQKALSYLPAAHKANFLFQYRITNSLPQSDASFRRKVLRAIRHYEAFAAHGVCDASEAVFYEFGAGWDLVVPVTYYALGVDQQIVVDVRPNVRLELVHDAVLKHAGHRADLEQEVGRPLRPLDLSPIDGTPSLSERFGISYLAPLDTSDTRLPSASVDFISSTNTLEHIPQTDIGPILEECRRLLRPNGVMSCRIDLRDHYAYFDKSISPYNFLKFSDRAWRLVNSSLHYQNRLRYPDYVRLVQQAGLEIVAEEAARPGPADLETLREMTLAPRFRDGYSLEDVGVKGLAFVARPASGADSR